MKKLFVSASLILLGLFAFFSVQAAEIIKPDRANPNVTVGSGETHKNLYVASGNVTVDGDTLGDLVAAGGMVNITGSVEQDLLLAGGTLNVSGQIGGDARVAGGNVSISSPIDGDLVLGGGNVQVSSKSSIGGDVLVAGGNINLDAPVAGSVKILGGNVTINSKIGGDVFVQSNQNLTFGPQAEITGKVTYRGPKPATVASGAKVGSIDYTQINPRGFKEGTKALLTAAFFIKLLAYMVIGLLLIRFKKKFTSSIVEHVQAKPWSNLGIGLLGIIVLPIIIVLLFVTIIGYYLAILVGIGFVFALALANVMAALVTGYFLMRYLSKPSDKHIDLEAVIIGVVIWSLLGLIPVVGWIILLLVYLAAFGALLQYSKVKIFQDN